MAKYTPQQYTKFNGQTVMKALQSMDYQATSNKLSKYIATNTNQRLEDVHDTVKRVLRSAVANGFLITRGKSYRLPSAAYTLYMDGKRVNRKRNSDGKVRKLNANNPKRHTNSRQKVNRKEASKGTLKTRRN